jgi:hypothetical protein
MNEDRIALIVQAAIAHSHIEQASVLRERVESRSHYLGQENVALLWALIMSHEAAAKALLEAAKDSQTAALA